MFKGEVFQLISQVFTSWQVIFVTIALLLFLNLIFNAAKTYRKPKVKKVKIKKVKPEPAPLPESESEDENEELEE
jgi:hypothetical protein